MKKLMLIVSLIFIFNSELLAGGSYDASLKPIIKKNENSSFCKNIKKKMRTIVSGSGNPDYPNHEIDKYFLWPDRSENGEDLFNIDVDGDSELDDIKLSCSGSISEPSEPCFFSANLSKGNKFDLSGWNIRLMKYGSKFYVAAHHDDESRNKLFTDSPKKDEGLIYHPEVAAAIKYQLYIINATGLSLICKDI